MALAGRPARAPPRVRSLGQAPMRARLSDKRHVAQDVGRVAADGRLGQQLLHALAGAALGGVRVQHIYAVPEPARPTRMLDARKVLSSLG